MNNNKDYKKIFAIQKSNAESIKKLCPNADNRSGIYAFLREENGIIYSYLGQAKSLLERMSSHLSGYVQHIDISLKKRKIYNKETNPQGWFPKIICYCTKSQLNELEQKYIMEFMQKGYQMPYNKTLGGQNAKVGINDLQTTKNYTQGKKQGYKNARRDVSKLFEKNLTYSINGVNSKNKEKALLKFEEFLNLNEEEQKLCTHTTTE